MWFRRRAAFFSCAMDTMFVDNLEQLPELQQALEGSSCITLDVEWKPNSFTPHDHTAAPVATAGASAEFMQSGRISPRAPGAESGASGPQPVNSVFESKPPSSHTIA